MSANLQILFDSIDQGMMILSPEGVVRFANQAVIGLMPVVIGKPLASQGIVSQVTAVAKGYVRLPLEFEIDATSKQNKGDRLLLKLLESPVGGGYLLVIRNVSEATRFENVLANFANMITEDLQTPLLGFAAELNKLLLAAVPDNEARYALNTDAREILGTGEYLVSQVIQLATFAQVFAKSPVIGSERIQMGDLVATLLIRLRPLLDRRRLKVHMAGLDQELPVIYGSRDWLVEALYGAIEYLAKHSLVSSDLTLTVNHHGNFVALNIENRGRRENDQGRHQSFLPFAGNRKDANAAPSALSDLSLGLPLCKKIVELHHGHLRINDDGDEMASLLLELPAGAPVENIVPNLDAEQAQRYARDLMRLMKR